MNFNMTESEFKERYCNKIISFPDFVDYLYEDGLPDVTYTLGGMINMRNEPGNEDEMGYLVMNIDTFRSLEIRLKIYDAFERNHYFIMVWDVKLKDVRELLY